MHEILRSLTPGAVALDLGSGAGSFRLEDTRALVVRVDIKRPADAAPENFILAAAEALPFRGRSMQAVISNHSLEHLERLEESVREIGRVLRPEGSLYIAVPDSTTPADRIYRWLGRGGGHVNPFPSFRAVPDLVTSLTGMNLSAAKVLHTSFSFLDRKNFLERPPRKLLLFAGGRESIVRALTLALRLADRLFGTRWSVYGWAYYFGSFAHPVDPVAWTNVCVRCGAAHAADWLVRTNCVRRGLLFARYRCPACGAENFYTADH